MIVEAGKPQSCRIDGEARDAGRVSAAVRVQRRYAAEFPLLQEGQSLSIKASTAWMQPNCVIRVPEICFTQSLLI